jgi:hypothetical protein
MDAGNKVRPPEIVPPGPGPPPRCRSSLGRSRDAAAFAALRHALRRTDPVAAAHDEARPKRCPQASALPRLQASPPHLRDAASGIATLGSAS